MALPGAATRDLDAAAEEYIRSRGGEPAFKGYVVDGRAFPASICASVDEEVVHGIPGARRLRDGELLSIDVGVRYNGWYGDGAWSVPVGTIDEERARLLRVTEECLERGVAAARAGAGVFDIGRAVQEHAEAGGYGVVRELSGHGIGRRLHEEPSVPNFVPNLAERKHYRNMVLREGMTICIEPMINAGTWRVRLAPDGWTIVTADGRPSAHVEHTVVIVDGAAKILTTC